MNERQQVEEVLRIAGILPALGWAHGSAAARTYSDYDPAAGYDARLMGYMGYVLLENRLDRVFSCGDFVADDAGVGLDLVADGLLPGEFETMPSIFPGLVVRKNLNNSPGWMYDRIRWLLTSYQFGAVNDIRWAAKGPTKQRVATQDKTLHPDQTLLLDNDMFLVEAHTTVRELNAQDDDTLTLVLAHSLDPATGRIETHLGRPSMNRNGEPAWDWTIRINGDAGPGAAGVRPGPIDATPLDPNDLPDAPVRLRPESGSEHGRAAGQA
ncbi:hypothetical protein [Longispora urticae]